MNIRNNKRRIIVSFILILGILLRIVYLGVVPGGMHQDEVMPAWTALSLIKDQVDSAGNLWPIYIADWGDGHSALYSWIMIPFLLLNGLEWTPFVSRLPQAVMGILTIAAVYFLIRKIGGGEHALWASFLLAICPWHVMMCRWGLDANLAPAFLIFGLYFFILGLDNNKYFIISAILYGLSLYCYAVLWLVVPVILFLQILYGVCYKKITLCRTNIIAVVLLGIIALPLIVFWVINTFELKAIELPFMTIPIMPNYRGAEVSFALSDLWKNFKQFGWLFVYQNTGNVYDVLMPYGMFYDIGRIFIVVGIVCLLVNVGRRLFKKELTLEFFLLVQLVAGGVNVMLVTAKFHQVNSIFIPLVLCEAYGVVCVLKWLKQYKKIIATGVTYVLILIFMVNLTRFQIAYYTRYKDLVNAYWAQGVRECVSYAMEQTEVLESEVEEPMVIYERAAQWPRVLLFTDTSAPEYLSSVVYKENGVEPLKFMKDNTMWYNGVDYGNIEEEAIYIIYFPEASLFEGSHNLTQFYDWYVAVPKLDIEDD